MKPRNLIKSQINLSTPILLRARCKKCGEIPNLHYILSQRSFVKNPNITYEISCNIRNFTKRMNSDWYFVFPPRDFSSANIFSFNLYHKGYQPKLYSARAIPNPIYMERLTCSCGLTTWSWMDMGAQNILEHKHRRARKPYDHKLSY